MKPDEDDGLERIREKQAILQRHLDQLDREIATLAAQRTGTTANCGSSSEEPDRSLDGAELRPLSFTSQDGQVPRPEERVSQLARPRHPVIFEAESVENTGRGFSKIDPRMILIRFDPGATGTNSSPQRFCGGKMAYHTGADIFSAAKLKGFASMIHFHGDAMIVLMKVKRD